MNRKVALLVVVPKVMFASSCVRRDQRHFHIAVCMDSFWVTGNYYVCFEF